jgi:ABC-type transport system involved in multi-copper enzyme maturation permease subunit
MNRRIWSLAVITFKEGIRDRTLYGIGLFALMIMGLSLFVTGFFLRELHKVTVDINISAITFGGLLIIFSLSVNLMSKDLDKRTVYSVLSKPFSRTQYLIGKFLGLVLLSLAALCMLTFVSTLTIWAVKSQYPVYFKEFVWLPVFQAVYAEFLMFMVLNAVVIFFSTVTTSSFLTLLFTISTYIIGQTVEEVVQFIQSQAQEIQLTTAVKTIIDMTQYIVPNLSVYDLKIRAAHGLSITSSYLLSITGYSLIYSTVLILLASIIFSRRELT